MIQLEKPPVTNIPKEKEKVNTTPKENGEVNCCCSWEKIAIVAASLFAVLALAGHFGQFLPPAAVYACSGVSCALVLATIVMLVISKRKAAALSFEWSDMICHARKDCSLGLRHVLSENAEAEKQNGFEGDALNLDITDPETWKKIMPQDSATKTSYSRRDAFCMDANAMNDLERLVIMGFWKVRVEQFIRTFSHENSAFLLINYGEGGKGGACDLDQYGQGLGKKGKKNVTSAQVIAVIQPPIGKLSSQQCVDYYFNEIIKNIRLQFPPS